MQEKVVKVIQMESIKFMRKPRKKFTLVDSASKKELLIDYFKKEINRQNSRY